MRITAIREEDWAEARALRLEMLADTPLAYLETLEAAVSRGEDDWRARARRGASAGNVAFAAVADSGRWVGSMNCFVRDGAAHLVSVYVSPGWRGRDLGVTDALLDRVIEWARTQPGVDSLELEVHERNDRATAYYRRRGFRMTGNATPYAVNPAELDLEMALPLGEAEMTLPLGEDRR